MRRLKRALQQAFLEKCHMTFIIQRRRRIKLASQIQCSEKLVKKIKYSSQHHIATTAYFQFISVHNTQSKLISANCFITVFGGVLFVISCAFLDRLLFSFAPAQLCNFCACWLVSRTRRRIALYFSLPVKVSGFWARFFAL